MEKLLQYAWQYRLWENPVMRTTTGQRLEILDPGWLNTASGPDFFNSKLFIDSEQWAGNVEIHVKASDWLRHGHQNDPAYNNVILHVVSSEDTRICRSNGKPIPQVEFKPRKSLTELSSRIKGWKGGGLLCSEEVCEIPQIYLTDMLDSLAYERLYSKSERFEGYLEKNGNDYEAALYVAIARALGFGINSDPLERVALSVPLSVFRKHSDNLLTLEAILLGQAGLIRNDENALQQEYDFMKVKFSLSPLSDIIWKHSGTRPVNFPERRLRLLARILFGGFNKMGALTNAQSIAEIAEILIPDNSGLSQQSVNSLIINAVIPALFTYGNHHRDNAVTERVIDFLHQMPAEKNRICELFGSAGIKACSAYHSQALLQLRSAFCTQRKCLYCRIGNRILRKK